MAMEDVFIFWTGGWDSTFRMLQLSEKKVHVRPMYVRDSNRRSSATELKRMDQILSAIRARRGVALIEDIEVIEKEELLSEYHNDAISAAWFRMNGRIALGSQYEWFALLCKARGIVAELGLEDSSRSRAVQAISTGCVLCPCDEGAAVGKRMKVTPKPGCESCDAYILFKDVRMGVIDIHKEEMLEVAKAKGWDDITNLTWFCFNPINGKPCGVCNPCRDAMNEGMGWRMPTVSKVRYYLLSPAYLLARKIKRAISR